MREGTSLRVLEKISAGEQLNERNVKGITGISTSHGGTGKETGKRGNRGMRVQTGNARDARVVLRRTHCEKLLADLAEEWIRKEKQEKISGCFTMKRGEPVRLHVSRGQWE
ncbi:MAG: hypothetical protein J6S83_04500, partial [Lachnospiraceae bacterium]|nr:hypothetical protein [Lachnospiraceae bacterium]